MIPEIIDYLQQKYGQVIDQELSDMEDESKSMIYNPNNLVDIVFTKVKNFKV